MGHSTNTLSIEALENDLRHAETELSKATEERLRAHEIENQWSTEVTSLKNLIEIRRKRMNLPPTNRANEQPITVNGAEGGNLTNVAWIERAVQASGSMGKSPPEILREAAGVGRKMHKNYPYVALAHLVERGRIAKREGRYYPVG